VVRPDAPQWSQGAEESTATELRPQQIESVVGSRLH
jgi:hypothetical protein